MTALTKGRNTQERLPGYRTFPVKAGSKIFPGSMVAVDSSGRAVKMTAATGLRGVGRAEDLYDNTSGSDGDVVAKVKTGIFVFGNSTSTDAITKANIGADCYGVDDQTVAKTDGSSSRSVAGKIWDVTDEGVHVRFD